MSCSPISNSYDMPITNGQMCPLIRPRSGSLAPVQSVQASQLLFLVEFVPFIGKLKTALRRTGDYLTSLRRVGDVKTAMERTGDLKTDIRRTDDVKTKIRRTDDFKTKIRRCP